MTINGILQLISSNDNLCVVKIDNDLFSLNQIQKIVDFQDTVTGFLNAEEWWKHSKSLTRESRSTPDLSVLPHITFITPPYAFPQNSRIGDILGITQIIASKILESGAKFCASCANITTPQSLERIIEASGSNALAISAVASPEALSQHIFSKIIAGNEVKDFEEIGNVTSPLEVLIDRVKLINPDRKGRIQRALDFIEKNSLTDAYICSWPLGTFKHKVALASNCRECGTPFLPAVRMLSALTSSIWKLKNTDHPLIKELYAPLSSMTAMNFKITEKLKLNFHSPSTLLKDLDPGHLHIIKIQQCILEAPKNPVIISPFNYLLPLKVGEYLFSVMKETLLPDSRIIAVALPESAEQETDRSARCISRGKVPQLIEPGSHLVMELNRATTDEMTYNEIEHALPPNYKLHALSHIHSKNSQRTLIVSYLGILPHIARLYADHPTARALGLAPKFFSHDAFAYSCSFCGGTGIQCTICNGLPYPPDLYFVKFKGKSLARLLDEDLTGAMDIIGRVPKASTIIKSAVEFGLGSLRLKQTLNEVNLVDQWLLRILKFLLQTPMKSGIILPDLQWCLNENQTRYLKHKILERLEAKGIVIETRMKLHETRLQSG